MKTWVHPKLENRNNKRAVRREIKIDVESGRLTGLLEIPEAASGLVLFAHGSGSSRLSPRNQSVAAALRKHGCGTLLFDLLTPDEEEQDESTGGFRFDITLLAYRLIAATHHIQQCEGAGLNLGYFGSSTGAAAALVAAAELGPAITAVVSRGGRPDLAGLNLSRVSAPTLLIVGEYDTEVLHLNEEAFDRLRCEKALEVVPRATHLFEEAGALPTVAALAGEWFRKFFNAAGALPNQPSRIMI